MNLQDICAKYHVNKKWLIDGEGDDDNIFLKPSPYEIAYNRFGYIMENAIPSKRAALSVLLELVYATPDEQWEALMEQYNLVIAQAKGED